jgi:hypothetical protein
MQNSTNKIQKKKKSMKRNVLAKAEFDNKTLEEYTRTASVRFCQGCCSTFILRGESFGEWNFWQNSGRIQLLGKTFS